MATCVVLHRIALYTHYITTTAQTAILLLCFIFPFSLFRAAAASSQCVSLQHHVTSTPAQNFQQQRNRSKEKREEGGREGQKNPLKKKKKEKRKEKTPSQQTNPLPHLSHYMLYSNTDYITLYSTVSTQCTHLPIPIPILIPNYSTLPITLFSKKDRLWIDKISIVEVGV